MRRLDFAFFFFDDDDFFELASVTGMFATEDEADDEADEEEEEEEAANRALGLNSALAMDREWCRTAAEVILHRCALANGV